MAVAELAVALLLLLPLLQPATTATTSSAMNHVSGFIMLSILFILFPYLFDPKSIGAIDRPFTGIYPGVLRQYSPLRYFATMRASVWSVPIKNRINRNQGIGHT